VIRALIVIPLAAASLAACAPRPLGRADMPRPRAGLWEWVGDGRRGEVCWTGQPLHIPGSAGACSTITYALAAGGAEIDAVCGGGQVVSRTHMVFTGNVQSAYAVDTHNNLAVAGKPPIVSDLHAAFRFAGPCPPGRAADDVN